MLFLFNPVLALSRLQTPTTALVYIPPPTRARECHNALEIPSFHGTSHALADHISAASFLGNILSRALPCIVPATLAKNESSSLLLIRWMILLCVVCPRTNTPLARLVWRALCTTSPVGQTGSLPKSITQLIDSLLDDDPVEAAFIAAAKSAKPLGGYSTAATSTMPLAIMISSCI